MSDTLVLGKNGQLARSIAVLPQSRNFQFCGSAELDLTDTSEIQNKLKQIQPRNIINCASYNNVEKAENLTSDNIKINVLAIRELVSYCKKTDCNLIHVSTDYVFDGTKNSNYNEDDVTNPINEYGKAKLDGENEIRSKLTNFFIVRTSWLYSEFKQDTNFLHKMLNQIMKGADTYGAIDLYGSPTYSANLADIILSLYNKGKQCGFIGKTFHYSDHGRISRFEFIKKIIECAKKSGYTSNLIEIDSHYFKTLAKRPISTSLDSSKILNFLNARKLTWEISLERAVQNYIEGL
jgi:dTDP-4-dehydrorhamnose reductase